MELKQYLSALWKWSWLIALATVLAVASSYWATARMPRMYRSSITLMVGQFTQSANPTQQDFNLSQQLAQSYVQLVRRQPILQAAIDALDLQMDWRSLASQVHAAPIARTQLIEIDAVSTDPDLSRILADEIAYQLILQSPTPKEREQDQHRQFVGEQLAELQAKIENGEDQLKTLEQRLELEISARSIQELQSQIAVVQQRITAWQANYANLLSFLEGSNVNYLSVVEPATASPRPISPNVQANVLLAGSVGFLLAAGAALLLEYLDDTVKSKEDVDKLLQLPTLGLIPLTEALDEPSERLVVLRHPHSHTAEAYRTLRTNVQFSSLGNPSGRLLVTSAGSREGKTTTACNLAVTLAQAGRRVILTDTDLRRPGVHRYFGVPNQTGLTSLLLEETLTVQEVLTDTSVENLSLMTSGPIPPNPAELLGSEPMSSRLAQMGELSDVVILDSPPVLPVADAMILGGLATGVILVVDAGRTRREMARQANEILQQVGARVIGVVVNRLARRHDRGYGYYYPQRNGDR
jgi:non-specific protein-tyrosine kinase